MDAAGKCVDFEFVASETNGDFVRRGRGMPRMGPMGNPPRGFNGPMNMRGRGMSRGMPPRMIGYRFALIDLSPTNTFLIESSPLTQRGTAARRPWETADAVFEQQLPIAEPVGAVIAADSSPRRLGEAEFGAA